MVNFNTLLNLRLKQKESQKITALAERSTQGNLSSFSGVFQVSSLSEKEKNLLSDILLQYRESESTDIDGDLKHLLDLTAEVKAITNQAVILHGERIKKAQEILKTYKEGAFTAWLITTYGNRQTPYNFLQYYEFYTSMPKELHEKVDEMPRQAVYTLASRTGPFEKKLEIVQKYDGAPKSEILSLIRETFPLERTDKRLPNLADQSIQTLFRLKDLMKSSLFHPSIKQKEVLLGLVKELSQMID
ncbi:MAG: CT583 family protein [Chlamydiota bacterium]